MATYTPEEMAKLDQAIVDGQRAKALVDDPLFARVVRALEEKHSREWRSAQTPEAREACWVKQSLLNEVVNEFRVLIGSGKLAEHALRTKKE